MGITTRFPKIFEEQITPLVAELLELIQLQMAEIQLLRDEIARLKVRKGNSHQVKDTCIIQNSAQDTKLVGMRNNFQFFPIVHFLPFPTGDLKLILFGRHENAIAPLSFSSQNPLEKIFSSHFLPSC
ncbi:MAG: hypothetical protein JSW34_13725 [Candidatus Zixiibacteriota bacterium]|nr:MAG: hypothetical protein JSW34_13725 [candidate division Zixibacteria bacterium]